jgi:hypothetical protein
MPYYTECEEEGCKTLVPTTGQKEHYCNLHRLKFLDLPEQKGEE